MENTRLPIKIQLMHPGKQKTFKPKKMGLESGYMEVDKKIIRVWNNEKSHYRKFIQNNGFYLDELSPNPPKQTELFFWGEWEGNSFFNTYPKNDFKIFPNGIHKLFHSTKIRGKQNTDPYIYGKKFKYCICKQEGELNELEENDLILFGTVMPSLNKFYIDTVFVIKDYNSSVDVQKSNSYSNVYKEETLEQLKEYLHPKRPKKQKNKNKIYHSKTWWDDKDYFSFVPCKLNSEDNGFERLYIKLDNKKFKLSSNPTGVSFLKECKLNPQELWNELVQLCLDQNFVLGIEFDEHKFNDCL